MAERDIGALWVKEGPKGKFLSGTIMIGESAYPIIVFKNSYKEKPNQPDWRIYGAKPKERELSVEEKEEGINIEDTPF